MPEDGRQPRCVEDRGRIRFPKIEPRESLEHQGCIGDFAGGRLRTLPTCAPNSEGFD
jgi:hypothetical protein